MSRMYQFQKETVADFMYKACLLTFNVDISNKANKVLLTLIQEKKPTFDVISDNLFRARAL